MKKILIELYRYEKEGTTCSRCCDTTDVLKKVVEDFKISHPQINIEFNVIPLTEDMIHLSNTVKINGKDIKDIMGMGEQVLTYCFSCSDMMGIKTDCPSYVYRGKIYNSLPEDLLKEAIYKIAIKDEPDRKNLLEHL